MRPRARFSGVRWARRASLQQWLEKVRSMLLSGFRVDLSDLDVHAEGVRHRLRLSYSHLSVTIAFDRQAYQDKGGLTYDHAYYPRLSFAWVGVQPASRVREAHLLTKSSLFLR